MSWKLSPFVLHAAILVWQTFACMEERWTGCMPIPIFVIEEFMQWRISSTCQPQLSRCALTNFHWDIPDPSHDSRVTVGIKLNSNSLTV